MNTGVQRSLFVLSFVFLLTTVSGQKLYFPDSVWQTRTPQELKLNAAIVDSAVRFALQNEVKMPYDMRLANINAFAVNAREPNYKIVGPMKDRGKPAGLIVKDGFIVARWGDVDRIDMTFSVAKSYLSTVAGLAVEAP